MKTEKFSIAQGDCFELIKKVKTNSVDLILTDPPYNLAKHSTGNIKFDWRKDVNNDIADWDKKDLDPSKIADEFVRVLKPNGNLFVFCSYNLIGKWYDSLDHKFDATNFMVWHKTNPVPKFFKNGFLNSCEIILCCWNKKHKWNFTNQKEMHNFFESPICSGPERLKHPKHPTQKPLSLLKHIVKTASDEGDTVFDPFMGVASTGVAALKLNRKFVGIELEELYFEASKKRLIETRND
jgi:site-specific DNA-methyltransferase (adenine-specific)/modification methylase